MSRNTGDLEKRSLSQWGVRELARATGLSPTTTSRLMRGIGPFDSETISRIYAVTGYCLCCKNSTKPQQKGEG